MISLDEEKAGIGIHLSRQDHEVARSFNVSSRLNISRTWNWQDCKEKW